MKVTATRTAYVINTDDNRVIVRTGDQAEVDGRAYGDDHPMIANGVLVKEKEEPAPKQSTRQSRKQQEDKQDSSTDGE